MRVLFIAFILSVFIPFTLKAQDSVKKSHMVKPVVKPAAPKAAATNTHPYQAKPIAKPPVNTTPTPINTYAPAPVNTDKSLRGQYQYVLTKLYRYQQPMLAALWKNINDTLNVTRKELKEVKGKLSAQNQSINDLQNDVKSKDQTISDANSKQDEISFIGIPMPKGTYNLIMWGLVLGLAIVLTIVILRTSGAVKEARYRTKLFDELSEEFQAYKVKANDKEKKLARELQTERNKVDELMGRG